MYKNAIFDFDGTIINSYTDVTEGICTALQTLGFERPADEILKKFIGPSVYESMTKILSLSHDDANRVIEVYRKVYEKMHHSGTVMYEGFPQLLIKLKNAGVKLSIASTKPQRFIQALIKKFAIEQYFDAYAGPDDDANTSDKSELIKRARLDESAIMIGDRKFDIVAAQKVGIDSVGVTYGFMEENEFEIYKPTYIANNTDEIFEIITKRG